MRGRPAIDMRCRPQWSPPLNGGSTDGADLAVLDGWS